MTESMNPLGTEAPGKRLSRDVPRIVVPVHRLTRYLRTGLDVADGVMRWDVPRTLLGVLPIGERHVAVPVDELRLLRMHRVVRPFNLLVGAALLVLPWFFLAWWLALPLLILGLWVVLVALGPRMEADTLAGRTRHANVCFGHEIDAELYITAVTELAEQERIP